MPRKVTTHEECAEMHLRTHVPLVLPRYLILLKQIRPLFWLMHRRSYRPIIRCCISLPDNFIRPHFWAIRNWCRRLFARAAWTLTCVIRYGHTPMPFWGQGEQLELAVSYHINRTFMGAYPGIFAACLQDGTTALMLAAANEDAQCCQLLIDNGAQVCATRVVSVAPHGLSIYLQTGSCALFFAAQAGNVDVAKLLIDAGSDVDVCAKVRTFVNTNTHSHTW